MKKIEMIKARILDLFDEDHNPDGRNAFDLTPSSQKINTLVKYIPVVKRLKQTLRTHKIKLRNPNAKAEKYLMKFTGESVYKLRGMVTLAIKKSKTKQDLSKYLSTVLSFDYLNYPYKDIGNDPIALLQRR